MGLTSKMHWAKHAGMHWYAKPPLVDLGVIELDALRRELGMSQAELCRAIQASTTTYQRWLLWSRGDPRGSQPLVRSLNAVRVVLAEEQERRAPRPAA